MGFNYDSWISSSRAYEQFSGYDDYDYEDEEEDDEDDYLEEDNDYCDEHEEQAKIDGR